MQHASRVEALKVYSGDGGLTRVFQYSSITRRFSVITYSYRSFVSAKLRRRRWRGNDNWRRTVAIIGNRIVLPFVIDVVVRRWRKRGPVHASEEKRFLLSQNLRDSIHRRRFIIIIYNVRLLLRRLPIVTMTIYTCLQSARAQFAVYASYVNNMPRAGTPACRSSSTAPTK